MTIKTTYRVLLACLAVWLMTHSGSAALAQSPSGPGIDKKLDSPFAAFRGGIVVSPVASVDIGLDFTFPRLRLGASWTSRLDLDFSARFSSPSFGSRRDAVAAITACQVYTPGGVNRGRYFLGAGIGPSFGPKSGLGGKVFAGINFTPVISLEAEGQFLPESRARAVIMLRLSAL